jgi:hypothetical protein
MYLEDTVSMLNHQIEKHKQELLIHRCHTDGWICNFQKEMGLKWENLMEAKLGWVLEDWWD